MRLENVDVYVFELDNEGKFEAIGEINEYTSLIWPDKYVGYSTFELNAPVTQENKNLIKKGNIVWCGEDNACVIEIIQCDVNEMGMKVYKVKGRTLETLLTTRIIWGTYACTNLNASTVMYEIVDRHCVNPSDSYRKIPFLECAYDEKFGQEISFQKTGGEVYDTLESIANDAGLGFDVLFKPAEKKLIFKVTKGIDRSLQSDPTNFVIFSTDLEDIISSSYYMNNQEAKTLALVAGEGDGAGRITIVSGNSASKGFNRKEMYVDARDLRSEVIDEAGNVTTINSSEYRDMLNDRGTEKLAENILIESFEAKIRTTDDVQYKYGIDYVKGDTILIQDVELGIQVAGKVTEVTQNFDDEYELVITFGYSYPTLIQAIKRKFS